MHLSECLEKTALLFQEKGIEFAIAGGLAASLYRDQPRLTGDVDVIFSSGGNEIDTAKGVLNELGFTVGKVREAEFAGGPLFLIKRKSTAVVMMVGREKGNPNGVGTDLLLPRIPWVDSALKRSKSNLVDFGFGKVPVLTIEDVILSKLYAVSKTVNRPKDLDDLQSIFQTNPEVDLGYLRVQIENMDLKISKSKQEFLPGEVRTIL